MTSGVTATWVPHRRNLIEAIKERPKPASTNRNSVEKSTSKKNGSTTGAINGEIELPQTQPRDTQPDVQRNVTKRVEKNQPTMTTNDNRDTNNSF